MVNGKPQLPFITVFTESHNSFYINIFFWKVDGPLWGKHLDTLTVNINELGFECGGSIA